MPSRKQFSSVQREGIDELQELRDLVIDKKELIDYRIIYIQRRIARLSRQLKVARDDFIDFCRKHNIDDSYIALKDITGDDVYPDTTPEDGLAMVKVEDAMIPNPPDESILNLKVILTERFPTLEYQISEHLDLMYKIRSRKASLEYFLFVAKQAQKDFNASLWDNEDIYKILRKNMEDLKTLQRYLIEFRSIFNVAPDSLTSETASRFFTNSIDQFGLYYVAKKKSISKSVSKMIETFGDTYAGDAELQKYIDLFNSIYAYFTYVKEDALPRQYPNAVPIRNNIVTKVNDYISRVQDAINKVKFSLEALRGTSGTGNAVLDSAITNTLALAESPSNYRRLSRTSLNEILETIRIKRQETQRKINDFKAVISDGVSKISDNVARGMKNVLVRLSGYRILRFVIDPQINKEDHVREKVRRRYGGNIPFCDETIITDSMGNVSFVKKIDIDPKTRKKKVDVEAQAAFDKSGISNNIFN